MRSLGASGAAIGLGTGALVPDLTAAQAALATPALLLFWWAEVPEELLFRGDLQRPCLQPLVGQTTAMLVSALVWDLAHVWSLAKAVERLL